MTENKPKNIHLLDYLYPTLNQGDLDQGIDLYRSAKFNNVNIYKSLLEAKIHSWNEDQQVRIKLHPTAGTIQWAECHCRQSRNKGQVCKHIIALCLFIDHERNDFVQSFQLISQKSSTEPFEEQIKNYSQLDFLIKASKTIIKKSFVGQGPKIEVECELKTGKTSSFTLDIDESGFFLANQLAAHKKPKDDNALKIMPFLARLGYRIFLKDHEIIGCEFSLAIPCWESPMPSFPKSTVGLYAPSDGQEGFLAPQEFVFFPIKSMKKYIGEKYCFLPNVGYFQLIQNPQKTVDKKSFLKIFKNDAAADLVSTGFSAIKEEWSLWVEPSILKQKVEKSFIISKINVLSSSSDEHCVHVLPEFEKLDLSMYDVIKQSSEEKRNFIKTPTGWFKVPDFIKECQWELDHETKSINVGILGFLKLKALAGSEDKITGSKEAIEKLKSQCQFDSHENRLEDEGHNLSLRDYQRTGTQWLWWLYKNRLNGLLADDMGLGKTHQAMAFLLSILSKFSHEREIKFLIICPTTVLDHWEDKILRFAPELAVTKYHGLKRINFLTDTLKKFNTFITSYGILLRDIHVLKAVPWEVVILDEAHLVKNNKTLTYKAACHLNSRSKLCLTGTPIENNLLELKTIFDFLVPGYFGSDRYFKKTFIQPIEHAKKNGETSDKETLMQKMIHPLKLRRNKKDVLTELPDKVEDLRYYTLSKEQSLLYNDVLRSKGSELMKEMGHPDKKVPTLHIFTVLQLLKQICDHPALVVPNSHYKDHKSHKFDLLCELLAEALESGQKVVIFTQYLKMIDIIKEHCVSQNIRCVTLSGKTKDRKSTISQFQEDEETKVFIGSLLAGGLGIDLTSASVVIHYDRWWNPSKENQATDRVYRIGQKKFVQIFKLVGKNTIEEKIDLLIKKKKELFTQFLEDDEAIFKNLSREDLLELLTYSSY